MAREEDAMTDAREREMEVSRRVRDNQRLVEFAVSRYLQRNPASTVEREDLVSWGLLGLYYAARAWDPARGLAFSTLAMRTIIRSIARGVRSERRAGREGSTLSLDALLGETESPAGERHLDQLADGGDSVEEQILRVEMLVSVRRAVAELSPAQQWVLQERYYRERTLREIAEEAGTSRQAIHLREQNSLRALRRKLAAA
jgi:RNA polymerase sigma factor FliA